MLIELALVWLKMHYVYRAVHASWKTELRSRLDEKTRAMPRADDRRSALPLSFFRAKSIRVPFLAFTLFLYHFDLIFEQVQLRACFPQTCCEAVTLLKIANEYFFLLILRNIDLLSKFLQIFSVEYFV